MRWLRDLVLVVLVLGVGFGLLWKHRHEQQDEQRILAVGADTKRLEMEVRFRAATKTAPLNARGWPASIDPAWFEQSPPRNALLDDDRPWVEVASEAESELTHPLVRMAVSRDIAAFWYNPSLGIVRARVPVMVNDAETTQAYNAVNGTALASILSVETPAHTPGLKSPPNGAQPKADATTNTVAPMHGQPRSGSDVIAQSASAPSGKTTGPASGAAPKSR